MIIDFNVLIMYLFLKYFVYVILLSFLQPLLPLLLCFYQVICVVRKFGERVLVTLSAAGGVQFDVVIVEVIFKFTRWDFEQLQGLNIQWISFDIAKTSYVHEFTNVFVKKEADVLRVIYGIVEKME